MIRCGAFGRFFLSFFGFVKVKFIVIENLIAMSYDFQSTFLW